MERKRAAFQKIERLRARMRAQRRERERTYDRRYEAIQARIAAQLEEINALVSVSLR